MIHSREYLALMALRKPERSQAGDMWLCRRLGIVSLYNGHKRGSRRGTINNHFHLYHFKSPSLRSGPYDWRDNDPNSFASDPAINYRHLSEDWEYVGNLFEMLPYELLAGARK